MSDTTEFPRAWRFSSDDGEADGDFLGRFTGVIEEGLTREYGSKPVARFIEEATGEEISVWLFAQALLSRMIALAPVKGELVKIEYLGKKKSKSSSRSYQNFRVTAPERPAQVLSWESLGTPEEEEED